MPSKNATPVPIALSHDLLGRIKAVAEKMGLKQQDVMRLAMEIGLEDLRRCNYNLAAAVVDKAKGSEYLGTIHPTAEAAQYRAGTAESARKKAAS